MDPAWQPPHTFDDLEVIRMLGAGGMGTVYLARERRLDRLVAVKFVLGGRDPHARERFRIEARALARLQHPSIVAVYRMGEVDDHPYLAYEFADGMRVDRLPMPVAWPEVLTIMLHVARGLAAAHAAGVLHRDLKPANLVVGRDSQVKILDFGLARLFDPDTDEATPPETDDPHVLPPLALAATTWDASTSASGDRLTSVGSLVGTPLYLAPEQWIGAAPTPQVDLYALGLIAYELLLGHHPRATLAGVELAQRVRSADLPRLGEEVPAVPRPLAELIDRLVNRDPQARPASAAVVRDELEVLRALYRPFVAGVLTEAADEVERSYARVMQRGIAVMEEFYARWFRADPTLPRLFTDRMALQPRMFAASMKLAIEELRDPVRLIPVLEEIGRRHAGKGVRAEHFSSMGAALLATLAAFDPEWTDATRRHWATAWNSIAQVLRRAIDPYDPAPTPGRGDPWRWVLPPPPPPTRWQVRSDGDVAWQEFGQGPIDVVVVGDWVTDVEATWRHPLVAGFLLSLAEGHRLIMFDRRGTGCSTRQAPTFTSQLEDLDTVLTAAGADRPVLVALGSASAAACAFAATTPRRSRAVILVGGGPPAGEALSASALAAGWGGPVELGRRAPGLATDAAYGAWWAALLRGASSPSGAAALDRATRVDVAPLLPAISAPTLLVHRVGDQVASIDGARRLAAAIRGARLVELDGSDHEPWAGDADRVVAELRGFLTELPTERPDRAIAATVLAAHGGDPATVAAVAARHDGVALPAPRAHLGLYRFALASRAMTCAQALIAAGVTRCGLDVGPIDLADEAGGEVARQAIALAVHGTRPGIAITAAVEGLLGPEAGAVAHRVVRVRRRPGPSSRPPRVTSR